MTRRKWLWPAAVLVLAVALAGCGGADDNGNGGGGNGGGGSNAGAGNGNDSAVTADAEAVFAQSCVSCHGSDLKGKLGPSTDISAVGGRLSQDEIRNVIANGRNGMPAFKSQLSADEIDALAAWLAAKQ